MPIHVAITRKVLPGKEAEFKEALRQFLGESFLHGGVHGALMISSMPGSDNREVGILRTFADEAERDTFYNSQQFKDWEAYASTLTEEPVYRKLTGLEAWFRSPGAPPRWKMALVTFCGVYPTSLFLSFIFGQLNLALPPAPRAIVFALLMVGILTWVVMPFLTKLMKGWLHARR